MTATITRRVSIKADPQTRYWVGQTATPYYDPELDVVLDRVGETEPVPVLTGPGEPFRAEALLKGRLPEGARLVRQWPVGSREDFCDIEF